MILKREKVTVERSNSSKTAEVPPPYSPNLGVKPSLESNASTSSEVPQATPLPAKTNYLSIKQQHNRIKGTFVIDPNMSIPDFLLAPLEDGEERKNMTLTNKHGSIDADTWLVGEDPRMYTRASLDVQNIHGNTVLKVHADADQIFDLTMSAKHGTIYLAIPSTFQGLLTINTHHSYAAFSPALQPHVRTFSDVKGVRKCFVGDFANTRFNKNAWHGSTIELDSVHGQINIRYADEEEEERVGFFTKLFGGRS